MFRKNSYSAKRQHKTSLRMESLEDRNLLSINISEVHFSPTFGNPIEDQYLEVRGEPNAVVPANTYFVGVESDGDTQSDNPGKINAIFDLSGLTFGSNGYLVFIQQDAGYAVDPRATSLQGTTGGFKGMPGGIYQGFTGQFESITGSESFLIVDTTAGSAPVLSSDIDTDDDGTIDAGINWSLLDSVTYFKDDNGSITGDVAYGNVVFRSDGNLSTIPVGATLVDLDESGYVARLHNSTGSAASDWVAGGTKETITSFVFEVSDGDNGTPAPGYFAGKLLDHVGSENFLSSIGGQAPTGNTIFVDRNDNGAIDDFQITAEPDDPPPTSQLINAFPGVTLTGADPNHEPTGFSITSAFTGSNSSTGTYSFSYIGITQFSDLFQMRMDFLNPTDQISIDFTGGSSTGDSVGSLKVFDANGTLLDTYNTALIGNGVKETATITRPSADISYAVAFADPTAPKKAVYLDNLRFDQTEESATGQADGTYLISPVWSIDSTMLVKNLSTGNTEAVRTTELSATHVDFDGNPSEPQDIFGRSSDGSLNLARPNGTLDGFSFENWGALSTSVTWDDIVVGDFNGDGFDDVAGRANGQWWIAKSTGDGFVNEYWGNWSNAVVWEDVVVGDFDGDGKDDIAGRTGGQWWVSRSQGTFFLIEYWGKWSNSVTWEDVVVGDFDDDGKDDIAGRTSGQWWISHSQSTFFSVEFWGRWSNSVTWDDVVVGDFDGDGKADIAGRTSGQWWISRSQGTFFTVEYWGNWSNSVTWQDVMVADLNGDNQSDIVGRVSGTWWVSRSNGDFFTVELWGNWSNAVTWEEVLVLDVNGDRMDDIVGRTSSTWWASVSQGSFLSVEHWGSHSDSVNWTDVQTGEFGTSVGGSSLSSFSAFAISNTLADDSEEKQPRTYAAIQKARTASITDRIFAAL